MLKKEYSFASYLAAGMLLGTLGIVQAAGISKDPKVLPVVLPKAAASVKMSGISSAKPYAEGEVIVVMNKSLSASEATTVLAQNKIKVLKEYKKLSSKSKGSYMLVSGDTSTEELVAQLKQDPNVKSVSPNYRRTLSATTDDTYFNELWGLNNTGQNVGGTFGTSGTYDADIDAPEAWDTATGSSNVVVAVFDTGVDYTHEDLSANMWVNSAEAGGTIGADDDGNGYVDDVYGYDFAGGASGENDPDPMDIMGHGTHVSGTIGAEGNNSTGITGVNWDVKIMALKVFRPSLGAYDDDIIEAIDYVLTMKDNGVNIVAINASYGGYGGAQNDPMNDAIKSLGDAGIVFCAAAGNENNDNDTNPSYPASYDASNIIAVAATDQDDQLASFSNYGATSVDIAAPGTNILSTLPSFAMPDNNIFSDDIESDEGNWIKSGDWNITTEEANSFTHAWSDSPNGNYANNTNASLTYGSDIDLSGYTGQNIGLGACLKFDIEEGYDYLYVEASADSGTNWTTMAGFTGTQSTWVCAGGVIPDTMKTANFRMRLRLETDADTTRDGVYVDDIAIGAINPSSSYAYWAGTSMATPHVTGSVALMAAASPDETVTERIDRILNGADKLPSLDGKVATGGRLNIANSIELNITESSGSGGGGGGCTYNPHTKSVDLMVLLMMMMSLFYPLRRKYLK
jgi:subtilisin family serine protease